LIASDLKGNTGYYGNFFSPEVLGIAVCIYAIGYVSLYVAAKKFTIKREEEKNKLNLSNYFKQVLE